MAKLSAPSMIYVKGEEMTRYGMQLILEQWIEPYINTSKWEFFDLSCKHRDDTEDQVLRDLVKAGKRVCAIFKEPTITPTNEQKVEFGLKKAWGSPNGAMRMGWNGITISRDTIMIDNLKLGYKKPVFFDRHAVGGEYGGGFATVGAGKTVTTFYPEGSGDPVVIDERTLKDKQNAVVTYHNPLDNVHDMAHHYFSRCLEAGITPYVTTKKTVFKWQEGFWQIMKDVFNHHYKADFNEKKLLEQTGGELQHHITDAVCMEMIKWTDGGFGMAAHNYDGDMLTDLMAQVHRSPGFISSALIGKNDEGRKIMEFEASHGTVSAMEKRRLQGGETSLNPLGLVYALIGAMDHSARLYSDSSYKDMTSFTSGLYKAMTKVMMDGRGTRDLAGAKGSTTEQFVAHVAQELDEELAQAA